MFYPTQFFHRFAGLLFFALLILTLHPIAAQDVTLPPGARLLNPPNSKLLPLGEEASVLEIDWTHPLLSISLESGISPDGKSAQTWDRAVARDPDSLRIQLVEPQAATAGDAWRLALPSSLAPNDAYSEISRRTPSVAFNAWCPWLADDLALKDQPEWRTPLAAEGPRFGIRWWGTPQTLKSMPSIPYRSRCLISLSNPDAGHTRFIMVNHGSDGEGDTAALVPWLREIAGPADSIALHSIGPNAIIGRGDWRLYPQVDPRRADHVGAVLLLGARKAGDPVDWTRMQGSKVTQSSEQSGAPALNAIRGLIWPSPLAPRIWMNQPGEDGHGSSTGNNNEAPWIDITFTGSRPVARIMVAWASSAGWTTEFNPAEARLIGWAPGGAASETLQEWHAPTEPLSIWSPSKPQMLHRIRLELPQPSQFPADKRARIASIQIWGPWDGQSRAQ